MRRIAGLCMAVAVLALAAGCGKKGGDTGGSNSTSIEGSYLLVGLEVGGHKETDAEIAKEPEVDRTLKITADQMITNKNGKDDLATYKLDNSKTPHEIEMTGEKGEGKQQKMYGIYKLEGDKLTLCLTTSDKPADRPKEFKTTEGTRTMLMTLKKK